MAIPKFFYDGQITKQQIITLDEAEARHASLSRRLAVGDPLILLNGKGVKAASEFVELTKRTARVKVKTVDQAVLPNSSLIVACAIPKGDRQKVLLDMLTQLGIQQFIPLQCDFSATRASAKLYSKWQRILIEACKQSENPFLPELLPDMQLAELVQSNYWQNNQVFCADSDGESEVPKAKQGGKLVIIGPEGGYSEPEIESIRQANAIFVRLGKNILRTETAAVAIVSQLIR